MNKFLFSSVLCIFFISGCAVNHLGEGISAGREGDYLTMKKQCKKATKQANADPLAFKCLAEAQLNLGHRQLAEESYLTYLSRVPGDLEARFAIINLYFNTGRYSAAQAHLETVLNLHPGHLEGLFLLGESHRLTGNCDAALLAYDKALQISPAYQAVIVSKVKAEQEVCGVVKKKQVTQPKVIKSKKFQAGGAVLEEGDW